MPDPEQLFVYGTLRRDVHHQLFRLLARYADFVGEASYRGRLFLVEDYPGAVPSASEADRVRGELYRLEAPIAILSRLDQYEEFDPQDPERSLFRREVVDVELANGEGTRAWIYLYNRPTDGLVPILSGDFLPPSEASRSSR